MSTSNSVRLRCLHQGVVLGKQVGRTYRQQYVICFVHGDNDCIIPRCRRGRLCQASATSFRTHSSSPSLYRNSSARASAKGLCQGPLSPSAGQGPLPVASLCRTRASATLWMAVARLDWFPVSDFIQINNTARKPYIFYPLGSLSSILCVSRLR